MNRKQKSRSSFVIAIILSIIPLLIGTVYTVRSMRMSRLCTESTYGTVVALSRTEQTYKRYYKISRYNVIVAYTVDGQTYNLQYSRVKDSMSEGQDIRVMYDPADPATAYVPTLNKTGTGAFIIAAVILFLSNPRLYASKRRNE